MKEVAALDMCAAGRSAYSPDNDNQLNGVEFGKSIFPPDAVARIFRPSRSVMTSGRARTNAWRLVFERRTPPFIEPLMGYCGGNDTLSQVELRFPTLEAAIRYAQRQGLTFVVQGEPRCRGTADARPETGGRRAFSDMVLEKLGLAALQDSYGTALAGSANDDAAHLSSGAADTAPMDVANDPGLPLAEKGSILMNWAWDEYLIDQAIAEGMPENGRPSRLHEVELALLALERGASPAEGTGALKMRSAA